MTAKPHIPANPGRRLALVGRRGTGALDGQTDDLVIQIREWLPS